MASSPCSLSGQPTAGLSRDWTGSQRSAFTLIEMLVSVTVLVLLVLMVTQVVGGAAATSNIQRTQLDADRQARLVFDRMAADFAGMVRRSDVDCSAYRYANYRTGGNPHFKRAGNDSILFFSQADAQSSGSTLTSDDAFSLVGYRVFDNSSAQPESMCFKLERLGMPFSWSDPGNESNSSQPGSSQPGFGLPFLTFSIPTGGTSATNVLPNSTITTYWSSSSWSPSSSLDGYNAAGQNTIGITQSHVLGEDVFRLEFSVVMKTIQTSGKYFLQNDGNGTAYLTYSNVAQGAFSNVSAIIVTMATLDAQSRARLGSGPSLYQAMSSLAGKLADDDTPAAATTWVNTLTTDTSIPHVVAANAHVYQRCFYLR